MNAPRTSLIAATVAVAMLSASPAWAQALTVQTSLTDSTVAVGDSVTLQVTVTARVQGRINVNLPAVDGLTELSRRQSESQSLSWSSAGQQVLVQKVYTVDYRADREGRFTIGPVLASVGSRRARSTPVTLRVGARGAPPPGRGPTDAKANAVSPPDAQESSLFLRYRPNQTKPYLGQALLLDLEVIIEPNQSFTVEETTGLPEVEGFWTESLERPTQLKARRITLKGREYLSYRVWRAALYPLKSGTLTIPPVRMQFSQGGGFFQPGRRMRRQTRPLRVEVKPLPKEGRPKGFVSTNVGQYRLTAKVDHRRVNAGKAVLFTLRLSGKGNISSAKLPKIDDLPDFRVFAPTVRDKVKPTLEGVRGYKEAEYLLMPQKGGRLTIDSVELETFDPVTGKYRTLKTKPLRVTVVGTPDPTTAPAAPAPAAASADSGSAGLALRPLRFTSDLAAAPAPPWRQAWFWVFLLVPAVASAGRAGWQWSKQQQAQNTPRSAQRAAIKSAQSALEAARERANAGDLADAHAKVAEALRQCGSQALGVSLQGLTTDAVSTEAAARGLGVDDANDLARLLEAADYARYAPSQLTQEATHSDINRAEQLVTTLSAFEGPSS